MGEPTSRWAEDDWGAPPARRSLAARVARLAHDHALTVTLGLLGVVLLPFRSGVSVTLLAAAISLEFGRDQFDSARSLWQSTVDRWRGRLSAGLHLASGLARAGVAAFVAAGAMTIVAPMSYKFVNDHVIFRWSTSPEVFGPLLLCSLLLLSSWSLAIGAIAGCLWHGKRIQLVDPPRVQGLTLAPKRTSGLEPSASAKLMEPVAVSLGFAILFSGPIVIGCITSGVFERLTPSIPVLNQVPIVLMDWMDRNLIRLVLIYGASSLTLAMVSLTILDVLLRRISPDPSDRPAETLAGGSIEIVASIAPDCQIRL